MILNIAISVFVLLELSNVVILYMKPEFRYGNSMASFAGWRKAQSAEECYLFTRYLVNWVANCKLIFIFLLLVLLFVGDETAKVYGVLATIASIGMYFVTLHPLLTKLDGMGEIHPRGYAKRLGVTIAGMMAMLTTALVLHLTLG